MARVGPFWELYLDGLHWPITIYCIYISILKTQTLHPEGQQANLNQSAKHLSEITSFVPRKS
jgi:hypothetical protein